MEGLSIEVVQDGVALSRSTGLGRLEAPLLEALRANVSGLVSDPTLVEAVQAPLEAFEVDDIDVLGLVETELVDLVWEGRHLWHVGTSGAGLMVEATGRASVWRVPNGGVLSDHAVAFDAGWFASAAGLHRLDAQDAGAGALLLDASPALAVEQVGGGVLALLDTNGSIEAVQFEPSGARLASSMLDVALPDPLLSLRFAAVDGHLLLGMEGLAGEQVVELTVDDEGVRTLASNASMPEAQHTRPQDMEAANGTFCNGRTGVLDPLATESHGAAVMRGCSAGTCFLGTCATCASRWTPNSTALVGSQGWCSASQKKEARRSTPVPFRLDRPWPRLL